MKLVVLLFIAFCQAIYESDRGKNELKVDTLGDITDLVFIGNQQSYALASDSVLSLFDNEHQTY